MRIAGLAQGHVPWSILLRFLAERRGYIFGLRKAYGDFMGQTRFTLSNRQHLPGELRQKIRQDFQLQKVLLEEGFELTMSPPHGGQGNKNRSDIHMCCDMLQTAAACSHLDTFCIASGDSDFTPVIQKLKAQGKRVVVLGTQQRVSTLLKSIADEVLYIDQGLVHWAVGEPLQRVMARWLSEARPTEHLLRGIGLETLVEALRQHRPALDCNWFGHARWSTLFEELLDGTEWPLPAKGTPASLRVVKELKLVLVPGVAPVALPRQSADSPWNRKEALCAALARRKVHPEPALCHQVATWMARELNGVRSWSLNEIADRCSADLAQGGGEASDPPSRRRVRRVVKEMIGSEAILREDGNLRP